MPSFRTHCPAVEVTHLLLSPLLTNYSSLTMILKVFSGKLIFKSTIIVLWTEFVFEFYRFSNKIYTHLYNSVFLKLSLYQNPYKYINAIFLFKKKKKRHLVSCVRTTLIDRRMHRLRTTFLEEESSLFQREALKILLSGIKLKEFL